MKLLEVNPDNEKYYTKDFISGYRCGTKRQFEADLSILNEIIAEIEQARYGLVNDGLDIALNIIDKYKAESEGKE